MLAENIKKYRTKLGLTQEALARKADISYNTIIKLESKAITDPRMETLKTRQGVGSYVRQSG